MVFLACRECAELMYGPCAPFTSCARAVPITGHMRVKSVFKGRPPAEVRGRARLPGARQCVWWLLPCACVFQFRAFFNFAFLYFCTCIFVCMALSAVLSNREDAFQQLQDLGTVPLFFDCTLQWQDGWDREANVEQRYHLFESRG